MNEAQKPFSARDLPRLAYLWVMVGFVLGTAVLLGPVRAVTGWVRAAGWTEGAENAVVIAIIVAYVAASFLLALWLTRRPAGRTLPLWRRRSELWMTGLAVTTVFLWLQPGLIVGAEGQAGLEESVADRFVFGPYPDAATLERLRREGYTGVISLLHPAVVPFEPKLLNDERRAAAEAGIELISLPMLPWVGSNGESLDSLRAIARAGRGRYYVHCYLGRDRVMVARRAIESIAGGSSGATPAPPHPLQDGALLERGQVVQLEEGVFLTPFPTDEEFLAVIGAGIATVVSLLDTAVELNAQWIEREERILGENLVSLLSRPISRTDYDPEAVLSIAREVRSLPRPVLVHAFRGESSELSAFAAAYTSDLPPVLDDSSLKSMERGNAWTSAANLIVGPRPAGREFGSVLKRAGVRHVVYAGEPGPKANADSVVATGAGLTWTSVPDPGQNLRLRIGSGGTWFVYGPSAEAFGSARR